jgi:hypothetical protein
VGRLVPGITSDGGDEEDRQDSDAKHLGRGPTVPQFVTHAGSLAARDDFPEDREIAQIPDAAFA